MEVKKLEKQMQEHAEKTQIKINPDKKILEALLQSLLKRKEKFGELYCPCRVITGNKQKDKEIICPCIFHQKEIQLQGHCKCNLFVK